MYSGNTTNLTSVDEQKVAIETDKAEDNTDNTETETVQPEATMEKPVPQYFKVDGKF